MASMKSQKLPCGFQLPLSLGLAVLFLGLFAPQTPAQSPAPSPPRAVKPADDEFAAVSHSVIVLLQGRNTARFAREVTATAEDWKAIANTNLPGINANLNSFAEGTGRARDEAGEAAKAFLEMADSLHLDFSKGDLQERVVAPRFLAAPIFPLSKPRAKRCPMRNKWKNHFESRLPTNHPAAGEYKIVLLRLNKFPAGWRCAGGIQWESFPANVADEKTVLAMAILAKAASPRSNLITDKDDPALLRLGQTLVRFIRERDTNIFAQEALATTDLYWTMMQKSGEKGPSRKEFDQEINRHRQEETEIAQSMLHQIEVAGIDLKDAQIQIQEAAIGELQPPPHSGTLEGLRGSQFKLKLAVKTDAKSRTGASLSGDYVLAVHTS